MKKNLLLILVVTVISLAIITAVIFVSAGNSGTSSIPDSSVPSGTPSTSVSTTAAETEEPPATTTAPHEVTDVPVISETADEPITSEPNETPLLSETEDIIALAKSLIGVEFVDGGETPENGFDNSGFIYYVLRENGFITCPRGVAAQAEMGTERSYSELRAGDLVYFVNESGSGVGFGGIYIGDGTMIACLMPGTTVKEININNDYYKDNFYRGISLS